MRAAALLGFLLLSFASAQGIEEFVLEFRQGNESFSIVSLPNAGGIHFVGIGGKLVIINSTGGKHSILASPEEIFPLLVDYQQLIGASLGDAFPRKSEFEAVRALVLKFNASREPREGKCLRESGLDKFPCFDRESCFKACYTPLCKPIALGFGWPFIDNLSAWKNATDALEGNVSAFFRLFNPIADAPDVERPRDAPLERVEGLGGELADAIGLIRGMGASAGEAAANPIFDEGVYSFCDPIPFDWASLLSARRAVENFTIRLGPLVALANASHEVAEEGGRRARIIFEREQAAACANFSSRVDAVLAELEEKAAGEVRWKEAQRKLDEARGFSEAARKECGEGRFDEAAADIGAFERSANELEGNLSGLLERRAALAKKIAALGGRFSLLEARAEDAGVDVEGVMGELAHARSMLSAPLDEEGLDALDGKAAALESALGALESEVARREESARMREAALRALAVVLILTAALGAYYLHVRGRAKALQ